MSKLTKTASRKTSKANGKAIRGKAAVKRAAKATKTSKGRKATKANGKARTGGGKALTDFGNDSKLRILKAKDIPARSGCFKTGQTVSACLAAQKAKGFRGRRKFIRVQIAQGRVSLR